MTTSDLGKYAKITGTDRDRLSALLRRKYEKGSSIRELAGEHGRSYGFIHQMLLESGTTMRPRGGQPHVTVSSV
jgi:hypothetical protein